MVKGKRDRGTKLASKASEESRSVKLRPSKYLDSLESKSKSKEGWQLCDTRKPRIQFRVKQTQEDTLHIGGGPLSYSVSPKGRVGPMMASVSNTSASVHIRTPGAEREQ